MGKSDSDGYYYADDRLILGHIHLFDEVIKFDVGQSLCKDVYNHLIGQDIREFNSFQGHFITDIMVLDIDMLGF